MNGWVSILFTVVGGIMFLMKNKKDENGGENYTVVSENTPDSSDEINLETVTVDDVIADPSILDLLKVSDPDKYEEIARHIWQNHNELLAYVRSTEKVVEIDDKEKEVMKVLEEGILKPYHVGLSQSGEYYIEVFVKEDENIGWENGEKVGIVIYEVIRKLPDKPIQMIRDYQMANLEDNYNFDVMIDNFDKKYAQL